MKVEWNLAKKILKEIDDLLKEYEDKNKVLLQRRVKVERINPNALRIIKGAKDIYSPTNIRMVMQEGIDPMKWPKKDKKFKGYRKKYQKR